jgi:hypothetical protein
MFYESLRVDVFNKIRAGHVVTEKIHRPNLVIKSRKKTFTTIFNFCTFYFITDGAVERTSFLIAFGRNASRNDIYLRMCVMRIKIEMPFLLTFQYIKIYVRLAVYCFDFLKVAHSTGLDGIHVNQGRIRSSRAAAAPRPRSGAATGDNYPR